MISLPGPSRPPCFVVCDCVQNFLLLSPLQDRQREVPQRRRPAISPRAVMQAPRPESGRGPTGQKRDLLSPPGTGALAQPSSLFSEQPDRLRASWRPLWRLLQQSPLPTPWFRSPIHLPAVPRYTNTTGCYLFSQVGPEPGPAPQVGSPYLDRDCPHTIHPSSQPPMSERSS